MKQKREEALRWLREHPLDLPPCFTCGRVMLAGKCCDGPRTAPTKKKPKRRAK